MLAENGSLHFLFESRQDDFAISLDRQIAMNSGVHDFGGVDINPDYLPLRNKGINFGSRLTDVEPRANHHQKIRLMHRKVGVLGSGVSQETHRQAVVTR